MANAATKDKLAADMKPSDFRGAIKRMESLQGKRNKVQSATKEIQDIFSKCEGICGVDKTAAKMYAALAKMDEHDRLKVFRHFNGLADAAGWAAEGADLVDQAQDNVVHMRAPGSEEGGIDDEIEDEIDEATGNTTSDPESFEGDDDFEEATEEELAQQKARPSTEEAEAKADAAAEETKSDKAPDETDKSFTGDNSDLAPE